MALKDKLAGAKFNFKDLTFCLDGTLNARRDSLMQELVTETAKAEQNKDGKGDGRLGFSKVSEVKKRLEALEERMRDKSIVLRFTAVNNGLWQKWIIQNPPRKGNATDQALGYNFETFFNLAARETGLYVEDAGTEENEFEDAITEDIAADEWAKIFEAFTAGDWDRIQLALITLNQREGARGVDFLGRGSTATPDSEPTSDSPEN